MPAPDDSADLELIERCVREAGIIARSYYGSSLRHWDKGKGQLVTEADLAIDKFLGDRLRVARPHYGWLSEETVDDQSRLRTKSAFVVDPIDGTVAFFKGRPHFTISVAVVRGGIPTAGVVYNPISEECFTGLLGGGARLNSERIAVSNRSALAGCFMLGDKGMFASPIWNTPPFTPWPEMRLASFNSIAYRIALVAHGTWDAVIALSAKRDWDLAASDLILREAGGRLTTHKGAALHYNGGDTVQPSIIGAGPILHAAILDRVRELALPRRKE